VAQQEDVGRLPQGETEKLGHGSEEGRQMRGYRGWEGIFLSSSFLVPSYSPLGG
jgi:hypothetical protein